MHNFRITGLIIILLFVFGIIGFDKMAKSEFPDFVIRQGVVVAVYPGATAEEVEEQVAKPLERYLFTYDEVKRHKTTTTSTNGMCIAMVELQDNVNNKDEVWSKIKHGLNSFKSQSLPSGVLALSVNDDFGSSSALLIAIESENRSYKELKKYGDDLADRLRQVPSVSNAVLYGNNQE
ncbi:MAG: efflux RND transporter permease subunit, partial [Bacteroidaceae bacterium]|nr:efflux RND transporter permease subunit [Bacteroidaceae bacterium]